MEKVFPTKGLLITLIIIFLATLLSIPMVLAFVPGASAPAPGAAAPAVAGSYRTDTFTNNESEIAYDIHIEYGCAVELVSVDNKSLEEGDYNVRGNGTSTLNISNLKGVLREGTTKVRVKSDDNKALPGIVQWWWTKKGGEQLGNPHMGPP
jgi:hypothetical protein